MIEVQYINDSSGKPVAVVLPIEFWRSLFPEDETDRILSSKIMKKRLLEAMQRNDGYSIEDVHEKLGI